MKKTLIIASAFAVVFGLMTASAAMAVTDDFLADGLAKKISVSYLVWDALAGKFVNQTATVQEDSSVTSNNSRPITFDFYTDPGGGEFLDLYGAMMIGNKALIGFAPFLDESHMLGMPVLGTRVEGHAYVEGMVVVSGNRTYDTSGHGSGAGTELLILGSTLVKAAGKPNSSGDVAGKLNMVINPEVAVLMNYTGTGSGDAVSIVSTAVKMKLTPISFLSYSTIPAP